MILLYHFSEVEHVLSPLPPQDWPVAFGLTAHGERLYSAISVEPLLAAHDAERLAAEHLAWEMSEYLERKAGRADDSESALDNEHTTLQGLAE
jgi:hypothetical protein